MHRRAGVVVALGLLLALGFLLYRVVANQRSDSGLSAVQGSPDALAAATGNGAVPAPPGAQTSASADAVSPARAMPVEPVAADPARRTDPSQPRWMSTQDLRRVSDFASRMAERDERHKAFHDAAVREAPDPDWSPWAQSELTNARQRNFAGLDGLQASEVVCSRSICTLTAIAQAGVITAGTDWQRAMGRVMDEPWFASQFHDASTSMGSDERGMIYVTYFVRKP